MKIQTSQFFKTGFPKIQIRPFSFFFGPFTKKTTGFKFEPFAEIPRLTNFSKRPTASCRGSWSAIWLLAMLKTQICQGGGTLVRRSQIDSSFAFKKKLWMMNFEIQITPNISILIMCQASDIPEIKLNNSTTPNFGLKTVPLVRWANFHFSVHLALATRGQKASRHRQVVNRKVATQFRPEDYRSKWYRHLAPKESPEMAQTWCFFKKNLKMSNEQMLASWKDPRVLLGWSYNVETKVKWQWNRPQKMSKCPALQLKSFAFHLVSSSKLPDQHLKPCSTARRTTRASSPRGCKWQWY